MEFTINAGVLTATHLGAVQYTLNLSTATSVIKGHNNDIVILSMGDRRTEILIPMTLDGVFIDKRENAIATIVPYLGTGGTTTPFVPDPPTTEDYNNTVTLTSDNQTFELDKEIISILVTQNDEVYTEHTITDGNFTDSIVGFPGAVVGDVFEIKATLKI